jgi:hypothetical protein
MANSSSPDSVVRVDGGLLRGIEEQPCNKALYLTDDDDEDDCRTDATTVRASNVVVKSSSSSSSSSSPNMDSSNSNKNNNDSVNVGRGEFLLLCQQVQRQRVVILFFFHRLVVFASFFSSLTTLLPSWNASYYLFCRYIYLADLIRRLVQVVLSIPLSTGGDPFYQRQSTIEFFSRGIMNEHHGGNAQQDVEFLFNFHMLFQTSLIDKGELWRDLWNLSGTSYEERRGVEWENAILPRPSFTLRTGK